MAQERIKLTKKVYDKSTAGDFLNKSFSEMLNSNDNNLDFNIKRLFNLYNDLFYDIPKIGQQSHTTLFKQSRDYIGNFTDSKDTEIESLLDKIIELEEKLANQEEPPPEHPFYRNGTIIVDRDASWNIYYMEKATRRRLSGNIDSQIFKDLKSALGFKDDDNWKDCVTLVSPSVISSITPGPDFGPEDLGNDGVTNVEEELATFENSFNYNALQDGQLDPNSYPSTSQGYGDYHEYLKNRIISVWQSEKRFEILKSKYENDKEFGFTEEERNKASILREAVMPKIRQAQETLVYYKRIWTVVSRRPGGFVGPNSGASKAYRMDLAKSNFESRINDPVTDEERKEYSGWEKGDENFPNLDLEGLTSYQGEGGNLY